MSTRSGRRRRGPAASHDNEERWLLTYADMITLLMALFMVLFSIANVNKAKIDVLSKSLNEAFSGKILPGGKAIQHTGSQEKPQQPSPQPPIPAITPLVGQASQSESRDAAKREEDDFARIKRMIDAYARQHGLQSQVQTTISQRGLVIRLLTDKVLFDSGQAVLKPLATPDPRPLREPNHHRGEAGGPGQGQPGHRPNPRLGLPTNW